MQIGNFDTAESVFVIAEIGNNHEGDFGRAKEMVAAALEAGVDAVKFQTIVPDRLVSATQNERVAQLSRFQFSYDQFADLASYADDCGGVFLSTPFDVDSLAALDAFVPAFKIASSDNVFYPLLTAAAKTQKPILLSIGLCEKAEVIASVEHIRKEWAALSHEGELALLHCVSAYPTPPDQAGLGAIRALADINCVPGYSDHTLGIEAAVLSVPLGARIIEKHFTLDKNLSDFRDHQLSADPAEMTELVRRVRDSETLIGDDTINYSVCEKDGRVAYRRSIVTKRDMTPGTVLTENDLDWVRPGGGLAPGQEALILGKILRVEKKRGELLSLKDVE